ncbi:MAG TPA: PilZ domain-containing protein [Planctomycetota bacterium]|nr:PilZ domain-containing protein [Planctomycetota bacterium]
MAFKKSERRKGVRLTSKDSGAGAFKCEKCGTLPPQATVADVSENGVQLLFDWPEGAEFPLQVGDGMGFHLKVEGASDGFEIWSLVRRVDQRDRRGRVGVGVEFTGLDSLVSTAIQKALVSLAMTRLRTWRADGLPLPGDVVPEKTSEPDQPVAVRPVAAPAPVATPDAAPAPATDAAAPAAPNAGRRKLFLGEILLKQGALDPDRFRQFLSNEFTGSRPLGQELLERKLTTEEAVAKALAEQARLAYADPASTVPDTALAARLARPVFVKHRCVPLREEGKALVVAMASPPGLQEMEALREGFGRLVRVAIAPESALAAWRKRLFNEDSKATADASLRFPAQIRVEYRFMDRERTAAVDRQASFGLTREIYSGGLVLAGPLPRGITPERIAQEKLHLAVVVDCPSLRVPMNLACTPVKVEPPRSGEDYLIDCRIESFPKGGEANWARVCMVHGTHRFRPHGRAH